MIFEPVSSSENRRLARFGVIPAQAGIQPVTGFPDARFRGHDEVCKPLQTLRQVINGL
jgi:hypothetical protein